MNTPKERAELYRKAADTIDMCAEHGIQTLVKLNERERDISILEFTGNPKEYEFPLAVIEGKLVWPDDIVYHSDGLRYLAKDVFNNPHVNLAPECLSLSPPKPKTIMVELLVGDAQKMANAASERLSNDYAYDRVGLACKKALQK